jgi:predicted subunit of tRNA(5-methylaminomethyl-2-thiouridylate) methyltransferase
MLTMPEIRSLEDTHDVRYIRPLAGFGRGAVDDLVAKHLEIVEGDTAAVAKADYETEVRSATRHRKGDEVYRRIFPPEHTQSRVLRRYKS